MKCHHEFRSKAFGRAVAVGGAVFILFGLLGSSCPTILPLPPTPQPGIADVLMQNNQFVPQVVGITVGESVRWTNLDLFTGHAVTSGNPGDSDAGSLFDSGPLPTNQSFTHQFNEVGDFVYFDPTHPTLMFDAHVIVRAQ
jgi:plastocyanin